MITYRIDYRTSECGSDWQEYDVGDAYMEDRAVAMEQWREATHEGLDYTWNKEITALRLMRVETIESIVYDKHLEDGR